MEIGVINTLKAARKEEHGWYLTNPAEESILIPMKWVPQDLKVDDEIDVFIYRDSEDRLIATTQTPKLMVDEFAFLTVKQVNSVGGFVDIGLDKDLLIPFGEQQVPLQEDGTYMIHMCLDATTDRLIGSTKIEKFLDINTSKLEENQKVKGLVYKYLDLGYKVVVDNRFSGMLYHNQIFGDIEIGETYDMYIAKIREDGKLDLSLRKLGYADIDPVAEKIISHLKSEDGESPINDKTAAEVIYDLFGVSKKQFKKALGSLYKQRIIEIVPNGIKLVKKKGKRNG